MGRAGDAHQRPQLHQRFVVRAGRGLGHLVQHAPGKQPLGGRGHHVGVIVVQPGKHPQHVAVHGGRRDAKGNAGNGPGGVIPNAGQAAQGVVIGGQVAAVLLADDAGGLLHVVDAVVVPKPLPQLAQGVRLTDGQVGGGGQCRDKAVVIRDGRGYAGLLEHDLADPDMVGRRLLPKRQEPFISLKPLQQRCSNGLH